MRGKSADVAGQSHSQTGGRQGPDTLALRKGNIILYQNDFAFAWEEKESLVL